MTKDEALKLSKGSVNGLARMLGISHAAVSQWDEKKIPELRKFQINHIKAGLTVSQIKQLEEA